MIHKKCARRFALLKITEAICLGEDAIRKAICLAKDKEGEFALLKISPLKHDTQLAMRFALLKIIMAIRLGEDAISKAIRSTID